MNFQFRVFIPLMAVLCMTMEGLQAQADFRISTKDNLVLIKGTSSLHDWQCRVEQMSGQMKADVSDERLVTISSMQVSFVVASIRSVKENGAYYEAGMDKNVYKALNSEKYPTIVFNLVRINSIRPSGNQWLVDAVGTLRIAGTMKEVPLTAKASRLGGGMIFEGKVPLKMTDYKVDPPTALFGTIRTGNDVSIEFKLAFQPVK